MVLLSLQVSVGPAYRKDRLGGLTWVSPVGAGGRWWTKLTGHLSVFMVSQSLSLWSLYVGEFGLPHSLATSGLSDPLHGNWRLQERGFPALKVTQHHFWHTLSVKIITKVFLISRGGDINLISPWEKSYRRETLLRSSLDNTACHSCFCVHLPC